MPSVFSFKVSTEVVTGGENSSVALTKRLNLLQRAWYFKKEEENVRIKSLVLNYYPRTGTLGKGNITASIIDNRIDAHLGDRIINEIDFRADEKMTATWTSCIWLPKQEFINPTCPPVIFEMSLTECNMTAGYSIGKMVVKVEVVASEGMDKFIYRPPVATLTSNPYTALASQSQRFSIKEDRPLQRSSSVSRIVDRKKKIELDHIKAGDRVLSKRIL